ncbi:MAG TPA: hypothetical protein VF232_12255 [Gaiellaceae bacterium]
MCIRRWGASVRTVMYPSLYELWTAALSAADRAITTAVRAHVFSPRDAQEARRVLEAELLWIAKRR